MAKQNRNWILRSGVGAVALLAVTLCAAATPLPIALAEPARAGVPEVLEELDEIVSHGKRLELRLQEEEQRFYQIYNEVNDRQEFDVACDAVFKDRASYGSRILGTRQGCLPLYVLAALRVEFSYQTRPSYPCSAISSVYSYTDVLERSESSLGQLYTRPDWSFNCSNTSSYPVAIRPSAELVWMSRRSEFQANLARVIALDERLQALAGNLNRLAAEGRESVAMINAGRQLRMEERRCVAPPRSAPVCRD
jgi:hypothetical protein